MPATATAIDELICDSLHPFVRFISNMKDVVAYFGLRGVFGKGKVR
jgi:hypothetical protein